MDGTGGAKEKTNANADISNMDNNYLSVRWLMWTFRFMWKWIWHDKQQQQNISYLFGLWCESYIILVWATHLHTISEKKKVSFIEIKNMRSYSTNVGSANCRLHLFISSKQLMIFRLNNNYRKLYYVYTPLTPYSLF